MKESEKIQQIVQKNKNKIQPSEFKATQITVFGSFHNTRKLVFSFLIHKNRVFPKNILQKECLISSPFTMLFAFVDSVAKI